MSDDTPTTPTPGVATLSTSLTELLKESQALRSDVHAAESARRRAGRAILALLILLALFVALVGVVTWQNNQLTQKVTETNERMADCTTPGGRCYEEGTHRTSSAIGDIILASIYMSECARLFPGEVGPQYDRKLEACVYERLERAAEERRDQPPPSTPSPSPTGVG